MIVVQLAKDAGRTLLHFARIHEHVLLRTYVCDWITLLSVLDRSSLARCAANPTTVVQGNQTLWRRKSRVARCSLVSVRLGSRCTICAVLV